MTDWTQASATEVSRAIGASTLDPVALTEAFLERIASTPDGALIYARATPDRARAEAEAARARAQSGARRGKLDGVPVSWKDLFDSAGTATEAGTRLMAGRVPEHDAAVLARASQEGAVCLGKTHLSEIAFSGLGVNPMTATSPNLVTPGAAPGGSSSGAAASLRAGMASLAIGTDTGGSVRVPAAWNDLVGLKTTHGLVPLQGTVPLAAGFDSIGPLARTVEDAALGLELLGGGAVDLTDASLAGTHLAVIETIALDDLAPQVAGSFQAASTAFERAGARLTPIKAPELVEAFDLAGVLYTAEAWAFWGDKIEADPDQMWHHIRTRIEVGAEVSAACYLRAWDRLRALRQSWHARVAGFDAVICPTVPVLAPPVARLLDDDDYYRQANLMALRNTRIGNLMGLCAVTLPTGVAGAGVMLNGAPLHEARLLRLAQAAARALH